MAKKDSVQKRLEKVRPPRVQLTYDVEIGDAIEQKELPFVVGVVGDVKSYGVERDTPLQTYVPLVQLPPTSLWLAVRTAGEPLQAVAAVERAIHTIDKDLPVFSIRSMDQLLGNSRAQRRLILTLLVSFAALALLLAAVGIYGVLAYAVFERSHEIGIRMALGADAGNVIGMVLRSSLGLTAAGVLLGCAGALAVTRVLTRYLFEVKPGDPATFVAVTVLLAAIACCAP